MSDKNYKWIDDAWESVVNKVKKTSKTIGSNFPSMTNEGKYALASEKDYWRWTTAFWPGIMWLLYENTKEEEFKEIAVSCEVKLDKPLSEYIRLHHDVGFMWTLTAVKHYELFNNDESRTRALTAASHLCSRFNLKGNYIRAWNDRVNESTSGLAIIDCMMNLPLLYWASEQLNDPRFKHIAMAHADMVLEEFIREDGSVNHMVEFDPETGQKIRVLGGQGYSPESGWSRGTSWALYGLALSYRYTKEKRYLKAAKKVAHFFVANLPEDYVAYWDFRAPVEEDMPRDSSAAACAACGLFEISELVLENEKNAYYQAGLKIVKSLYQNYGNWDNDGQEGLIGGGTFNYPIKKGINISLIYGDYYFVEALTRLKKKIKK